MFLHEYLRGLDILGRFSAILYKGDNFCDFLFTFPTYEAPSEKGSTVNGKSLLPGGADNFL